MGLVDTLLGIERELWKTDAELYGDRLVDEALLVFAETGVIGRQVAVEAIRQENAEGRRWGEVAFDDARAQQLGDDAAALIYRVTARWEHEDARYTALASSVYVRRDEQWKLALHQQTPLAGEA
jgi:hypothetical protein